jgi:hypothetical protein
MDINTIANGRIADHPELEPEIHEILLDHNRDLADAIDDIDELIREHISTQIEEDA